MPERFEIRAGAESVGSYSADEIRHMAGAGRLHVGMEIRRLSSGEWAPRSTVKDLRFKSSDSPDAVAAEPIKAPDDGASVSLAMPLSVDPPAQTSSAAALPLLNAASGGSASAAGPVPDADAVEAGATQSPAIPSLADAVEIECPFCAELIQAAAKKCEHCGEFLDPNVRPAAAGSAISMAHSQAKQAAFPPRTATTSGDAVKGAGKEVWSWPLPVGIALLAAIPMGLIGLFLLVYILNAAPYYGIRGLLLLAAGIPLPMLLFFLVRRRS